MLMPTQTVDPATENKSEIDPVITLREFMRITTLSRATVYRMFALGLLERPVQISPRRVGMLTSTTQAFIASRKIAGGEK